MATTLSNPVVEINDQTILIKPNSLSFKKGVGEKRARTQSAGGNEIDVVNTEDAETKMSMIKFTLLTTNENIESYEEWQSAGNGGNIIRMSEKNSDLSIPFRRMTLISDNEIGVGAEGEFEVEFNGPPVS
jgi:hypothetical protein